MQCLLDLPEKNAKIEVGVHTPQSVDMQAYIFQNTRKLSTENDAALHVSQNVENDADLRTPQYVETMWIYIFHKTWKFTKRPDSMQKIKSEKKGTRLQKVLDRQEDGGRWGGGGKK